MFGDNERIDLFSDSKLGSERFVQKFMAIHDGGEVAPEQVKIFQLQLLLICNCRALIKAVNILSGLGENSSGP